MNIKSKELNDYGYVDEVLELVSKKNADQPEFLQAVTEVLNTLRPVVDANEELCTEAMQFLKELQNLTEY